MRTATVSGSFHRAMGEISRAVYELNDLGIRVLSPADPRVVESSGEFLFVASDKVRSFRLVQDRHIESIRASDFLWLVAPDGYVGQSASMEIGFAVASEIPIFGRDLPRDLTLRQYVRQVQSPREALQNIQRRAPRGTQGFLIDPHASLEEAQIILERISRALPQSACTKDDSLPPPVYSACQDLLRAFRPTGAPILN
jgi:hypothetical protein